MNKVLPKALEIIFVSQFSREIGLHFWINFLSLCFFSINFVIACLCEEQISPLPKECKLNDKNGVFASDKNVSKKALIRPSFLGDLLMWHSS